MAARGPGARAPIRHAGRTAHARGPAGPVVAVCGGGRRVRGRVGVAAARGLAVMALWERLAYVFGRGARERSEAERILLEADFGVEATEEILDRVSGGGDGDFDFRAALERARPRAGAAHGHADLRSERRRQDDRGRQAGRPARARG